jgi:hypothetical protein
MYKFAIRIIKRIKIIKYFKFIIIKKKIKYDYI